MADTQEKIKGRARINVSDDLIRYSPVKIEKPKMGQIQWGWLEVKELFDAFQSFLLLPESYSIIGVFFEVVFCQWVVVVESDEIPLLEEGSMIPVLALTYQRTEDGKVSISDIKLMD